MCDSVGWNEQWEEIFLDSLTTQVHIWTVRAKVIEMSAGDVFQTRTKLGMSQYQFAGLVGVTPITISRWERGETKVSAAYSTHIRTLVSEYKENRK